MNQFSEKQQNFDWQASPRPITTDLIFNETSSDMAPTARITFAGMITLHEICTQRIDR